MSVVGQDGEHKRVAVGLLGQRYCFDCKARWDVDDTPPSECLPLNPALYEPYGKSPAQTAIAEATVLPYSEGKPLSFIETARVHSLVYDPVTRLVRCVRCDKTFKRADKQAACSLCDAPYDVDVIKDIYVSPDGLKANDPFFRNFDEPLFVVDETELAKEVDLTPGSVNYALQKDRDNPPAYVSPYDAEEPPEVVVRIIQQFRDAEARLGGSIEDMVPEYRSPRGVGRVYPAHPTTVAIEVRDLRALAEKYGL